jgi:hypothetical protein
MGKKLSYRVLPFYPLLPTLPNLANLIYLYGDVDEPLETNHLQNYDY